MPWGSDEGAKEAVKVVRWEKISHLKYNVERWGGKWKTT